MLIGKNAGGSRSATRARSLRIGASLTALLLAGSAHAQAINLGGGTFVFLAAPPPPINEITNGTADFRPSVGTTIIYAGALTDRLGVLSLIKSGGSGRTLFLTGSGLNTYSGSTLVSAGVLRGGAANVFSPNSVLNIGIDGTVNLSGFNQSALGLTGRGLVANTAAGLATLTLTNNSLTEFGFSGTSTGNLRIIKAGTGLQGFVNASTRTGGTELQAGILRFGNTNSFGTGAIDVTGSATLRASVGGTSPANDINLGAGTVLTVEANNTTLAGRISGAGSLRKSVTANVLNLTNTANDFSGDFVLDIGQVNVVSGALGTGTFRSTAGNASVGLVNNGTTVLGNDIVLSGILNFELGVVDNVLQLDGDISGAAGRLFLKSGAGTLIATGNNSFGGGVSMADGTVFGFGSNTAAGTGLISAGNLNAIAAYADNLVIQNDIQTGTLLGVDTRGFTFTLAGSYSDRPGDPAALVKIGAGTLNLNGNSSYSAGTVVGVHGGDKPGHWIVGDVSMRAV